MSRGPETPAYNARSDAVLGGATNVLLLAVVFMEERVVLAVAAVAVAAVRFNADVDEGGDDIGNVDVVVDGNVDGCDLVEDSEGKEGVSLVCIHTLALSMGWPTTTPQIPATYPATTL
jgi:hypothetical protein